MARIKLGALVQDVRGSLNGNVFSRNRGGAYVRSKVSPLQPISQWTAQVRSIFKSTSQAWGNELTDGQRAGWESFAAVHPITNVFGDAIILAGVALFQQVNSRLTLCGQARVTTAPSSWNVEDPGICVVDCQEAGDALSMVVTAGRALSAAEGLFVLCSQPLQPGRAVQTNDYRVINAVEEKVIVSAEEIGDEVQARYPDVTFADGDRLAVAVAVINTDTGAFSAFVRQEVIVAAG